MHACIDLGSNSFHLLIGEWRDGAIEILERYSEKVQLGEGVTRNGRISDAAFKRGLDCLQGFREQMERYPISQYWALGTNTFRVTSNADDFIAAAAELGIEISVISGVQEAMLIYAGVLTALPASNRSRLVIDIGGGSTEVIVGQGHRRLLTESMAIGSVAWRDRFFAEAGLDADKLDAGMVAGREEARKVFAQIAPGLTRAGWQEAYASSGTVKMLAAICECAGFGISRISRDGLLALRPLLIECIATNGPLPGLKERRRDLLLPGWCVLLGLMEAYSVQVIHFSATALREGMLDFMVRNEREGSNASNDALAGEDLPAISDARSGANF